MNKNMLYRFEKYFHNSTINYYFLLQDLTLQS